MRKVSVFLFLFGLSAQAQYFSENAFQVPLIGWMGMNTTANFLRPSPDPDPWPSTDQVQIGLGYQYALSGYDLWWVTQSSLSLGYARNYGLSSDQVLTGFTALTGLRYNFATLTWRPFILGGVGLVTLFTDPNATGQSNTSARSWMTLQAGPGIEWVFTDEMSVQLETGALIFLDFQRSPRFSYVARLSYLIYF